MARQLTDDALNQLDAALSITPSPEAVAKVRERVRQDQESPRVSSGWWWAGVAAAALIAVGMTSAALLTSRHVPVTPPAIIATSTPTSQDAGAPARAETADVKRQVARAASVRKQLEPGVFRPRETTPKATHEPEVLVPADEGIALRKLLLALREGRATVPSAGLRVAEDDKGRMLAPTPIDIPSIKIEQLPGTPVTGWGGVVK